VLMEGGYSLQGISESVTESFLGLLGDKSIHAPDTEVVEPTKAFAKQSCGHLHI
jgi:acetoin utilization deacetylase AcuC-like enzyme